MTVATFERLADRFGPCELVRGEVILLSPGGYPHSRVVLQVGFLLEQWARKSRRGRVVAAEMGLVTDSKAPTVRGADVAYFSYRRLPRKSEPRGFSRIPPDLVVEVTGLGRGWREMVEKAGEYLRMGVDRVWIVDPTRRRVHVYRPDDEPTVLDEKAMLGDTAILPGFRCRVRTLFE